MPALRRLRRCLDALAPADPGNPTHHPAAAAGSGTLVLRDLEASPLRPADLMLGCAFNTVNEDRTGLTSAAEADAVGAVTTAIRLGINCLDTSAGYGAGTSEEFVGTGLAEAGVPSGPSWVDVWTKGGPELVRQKADPSQPAGRGYDGERVNLKDFSARGARAAFSESCARLGQERLAGFRIHDPTPEDIDEALGPDGFLAGLRELRSEGLIGQVSLGMNSDRFADDILRLVREAPAGTFNSALLAGGWNLLNQHSEPPRYRWHLGCILPRVPAMLLRTGFEIMLEAQQRGIMIHAAGIFNPGLLVGGVTYASCPLAPLPPSRTARPTEPEIESSCPLGLPKAQPQANCSCRWSPTGVWGGAAGDDREGAAVGGPRRRARRKRATALAHLAPDRSF